MAGIEYGVSNVHYASKTEDASGTPIFGTPKSLDGASELALSPKGEITPIYADNITYFKARGNDGYDGDLTVFRIPENFKINHLGEYKDANGVLVEKAGVTPLDFALLGQFETDDNEGAAKGKRFALYNVAADRTDLAGKTKEDKIDPATFKVPLIASPTVSDMIVKASVTKEDNEAIYNAWFDSVYYNPTGLALFTVTVTVTASSVPVSGATVIVGGKVGVTNASGICRIPMGNGAYDVVVVNSGYTAEISTVTVVGAAVGVAVAVGA